MIQTLAANPNCDRRDHIAYSATSFGYMDKPYIRWWWPHGLVDPDEIKAEVDQIAEAGFGGFEIQDVHHSIETGTDVNSTTHGWASEPWVNAVVAALEEANSKGLGHDMAFGPCWPLSVHTISPDDDAAAKELVLGKAFVTNTTYNSSVPSPFSKASSNAKKSTLVAVQAWRVNNASSASANPVYLDYGSAIDLTDSVTNNKVVFVPPDNATWLIFSAIVRGTGQQPEDYPHTGNTSYVVDHFNKAGVEAVTDFWDSYILSDELKALFAETPTAFMEDSLEMTTATYWTPNFPAEFKSRRGYDVGKILPVVALYKSSKPLFKFADSEVTRGAINDYEDTLSDLYINYHIAPLKAWANNLGIEYRLQPYGVPGLDSIRAAATVDIPEGESLGFKTLDSYRSLSGAAAMSGISRVSNELGAYAKAAYATTWTKILNTVNPEFAAGVSQNVLHGYSYIDAPGAVWPGWAAFTPIKGAIGYSESWGPQHPAWRHAPDFTGYLGRVQYILQRGARRYDCAFLRQNGAVDEIFIGDYFTAEGGKVGWSTAYIDPGLLKHSAAYVEGGRFAPDGGNYSIIAVQGDVSASGAPVLTEATAKTLYNYAKAGLPIVMIGDWSSPRSYGLGSASSTTVRTYVKKMLALENVANAATASDVSGAIGTLGVGPSVQYSASTLTHTWRQDGELDHYFFVANSSSTGVSQTVSVATRYANIVPVQLDPWSGNATVLPLYSISNGRLSFPLSLQPYQTTLITVVPVSSSDIVHAVNSTAPSLARDSTGDRLIARSTSAGSFTTVLDNGTSVTTDLDTPLATISLTNWTLDVDDWQPSDGDGLTGDISATKLVRHSLNLTSLVTWSSIEELQDVSGNGTYSTTFSLGKEGNPYTNSSGAYLNLKKFNGSFRVAINGKSLPSLDQLALRFDVTSWLKNGSNIIEIELRRPIRT
ncbi:hypothetical protein EDB81DRAFT_846650 [Dactylonectria macrodidyma]|uniref:Secreted protein n=1 Tax=Dactylonectria macrodidyma TaxID=307937 RepID=A0A9P9DVT9_9HYPO|nr:hypothetical protein EDB81DRAFT_846650 [Dactylonectria macrodidyma]